jgi:phage terminase large subunit GpA-like protein
MDRLAEACRILLEPTPKTSPSHWAAKNRRYAETTGRPGPRDPWLTPYVVPISDAQASGRYKRVVAAMGAQMGKTDLELDLMGSRLDQRPVPLLYVGPTRDFVTDQFEPRLMTLLDEAPVLKHKVARGKRMKRTRKIVAGVPVRLAHGGSSAALKSDPAGLAIVDEYDEMLANVKGQGDPLGLVEARGFTYADFCTVISSTPSQGLIETEIDPVSGLEFWAEAEPEDVQSGIWKLWQSGTRFHWAWPCPHCGEYFIPRFKYLAWPKGSSPIQARRAAYLQCPQGCADPITEEHKREMNARGVYVAPGQSVAPDGTVTGAPPESSTASFWVSGLASPFVTFGQRAEAYLLALAEGDTNKVQTATNAEFGECYNLGGGGDVPEWEEVAKLALPYRESEVPDGVIFLTAGVDVQKNRLIYVIRGWGVRQESWLITSGELWGATAEHDVWTDLDDVLTSDFGGLPIARAFIDAGFRPGKRDVVPEHRVYEYARRKPRLVYATKGFLLRPTPLSVNRIDVKPAGGKSAYGLDLVRLSTDFFKSWIHERLRWPQDQPGGWHLHEGVTEDYCRQIVSEARVSKPSGGFAWVEKSRNNHRLDCEALAYAAAYMLGVQRLKDGARRAGAVPQQTPRPSDGGARSSTTAPGRGWLGSRDGWLNG